MATTHHDPRSQTPGPQPPPEADQAPGWGHIDEASWESFPASDAPASSAGYEGAPPTLNGEPYTEGATAAREPVTGAEMPTHERLRAKADELKHQAERKLGEVRTRIRALATAVREQLQRMRH